MRILFSHSLLLAFIPSFFLNASVHQYKPEYKLEEPIESLQLDVHANVHIRFGSESRLVVESSPNKHIEVEQDETRLIIRSASRERDYVQGELPRIQLTLAGVPSTEFPKVMHPALTQLTINKHAFVSIDEGFYADSLSLSMQETGELKLASLYGKELHVSLRNGGKCFIEGGEVELQKFYLNRQSKYYSMPLLAHASEATVNDNASAQIWSEGTLAVSGRGTGSLHFKGEPEVTGTLGMGTLSRMQDKRRQFSVR